MSELRLSFRGYSDITDFELDGLWNYWLETTLKMEL